MKETSLSASGKRALRRFGALMLATLMLFGLYLFSLGFDSAAAMFLWVLCLYGLWPLTSALVPFWAGLGGVHPLAAFFPIGAPLLFTPCATMGLVCMAISLVAAVAGWEWRKRKQEGTVNKRHAVSRAKKRK